MINRILNFYKKQFWTAERYARHIGVSIGEDCSIATHYFGSEPYLIKIGNHVQITSGVKFFTHGGGWVFRDKHPLMDTFGKIEVGNNVYIGNNSFILPGVTIGNDVIVGAGSVVTKSVSSGMIVAGNPAKVIGSVSSLEKKLIPFNTKTKKMNKFDKKKYLLNMQEDKFIKK